MNLEGEGVEYCIMSRPIIRVLTSYHAKPCAIMTYHIVLSWATGTAAAQAAAIAASEIHGTGRKKGKEKVHENRWKVAADAAANASKHGQ